jgi:hypothetical protein
MHRVAVSRFGGVAERRTRQRCEGQLVGVGDTLVGFALEAVIGQAQYQLGRIARLPLGDDVDARALAARDIDRAAATGRREHQVARIARAVVGRGQEAVVVEVDEVTPVAVGLDAQVVAARVGLCQRDVGHQAHLAERRVPAVADQARHLRLGRAFQRVVGGTRRGGGGKTLEVEWLARLQVDDAAQAAFDQAGRRILVHVDAGQQFGRDVFKRQVAPGVAEHLAPVEQGLHLRQAADRHALAFALVALDLDARHALQRFGDIAVGELADVFGCDRIDDLRCILLDVHRAAQRCTQARHHHHGRVRRRRAGRNGAHRLGHRFGYSILCLSLMQQSRRCEGCQDQATHFFKFHAMSPVSYVSRKRSSAFFTCGISI